MIQTVFAKRSLSYRRKDRRTWPHLFLFRNDIIFSSCLWWHPWVVHSQKSWIICLTEVNFHEYQWQVQVKFLFQIHVRQIVQHNWKYFFFMFFFFKYLNTLHIQVHMMCLTKKSTLCQADNTRSEPLLWHHILKSVSHQKKDWCTHGPILLWVW